jgi:hypothetical protein
MTLLSFIQKISTSKRVKILSCFGITAIIILISTAAIGGVKSDIPENSSEISTTSDYSLNSRDPGAAQERKLPITLDLLERLKELETQILISKDEQRETISRLIEENKILEAQQNKLMREIVEYRRRIKEEASGEKDVKIGQLEQEIIALKNQLLLKETEIMLLTNTKNDQVGSNVVGKANVPERHPLPLAQVTSDVQIAEVIAPKVNLRSGPGTSHAPVMQIQKGARLVIETKQGDWYRIITPNGGRAYVQADVIRVKNEAINDDADMVPFGGEISSKGSQTLTADNEVLRAYHKLKQEIGRAN